MASERETEGRRQPQHLRRDRPDLRRLSRAVKGRKRPRIEVYLDQVDEPARENLFRNLLQLEVRVRRWVKKKGIKPPRYGAVGKHGSIAVVERLIRTIKDECTRRIMIPQRPDEYRNELELYIAWHNEHRPQSTLDGKTPNEVYFRR